jgi:hypothetical protein
LERVRPNRSVLTIGELLLGPGAAPTATGASESVHHDDREAVRFAAQSWNRNRQRQRAERSFPIKDKVSEAVGGDNDGDKGNDKMKFINIVEELDLPVPRAVAYKAWTQFEEFPSFMKKVENVEQQEDQTVEWKAQIFWSSSASSSRGTTAKKSTTSSSRSRS